MRRTLLLTFALLVLAVPSAADAATRWVIKGRGYGHGIGLSQYGAYGLARHGRDYREILRHYYRGTELERAPNRPVRVLLGSGRSLARFRGANRLAGVRNLSKRATYTVRPSGGQLALMRGSRRVGTYPRLRVYRRGGVVRLLGSDRYRGALDFRPGGGMTVINRLKVDDYVKGVVAGEVPSSWHYQALRAQAVAARSYGLATRKRGRSFDVYPDTRSQVYNGVNGETARTNSAVRATSREVVTHGGEVAVTYFFSTSGGHTENVENVFLGSDPEPWLKGVEDPHDDLSPHHRWRRRYTSSGLDAALGSYSPGRLRRIKVLRRGVSPRIVRARVYGSRGRRRVSGPALRSRLGLRDTWARFYRVSTSQARAVGTSRFFHLGTPLLPGRVLTGVFEPRPRTLVLERRSPAGRWHRLLRLRTSRAGRYRVKVRRPGRYRVRAGDVAGPPLRVR